METAGKENHDPSEIVIDEVVGQWIALLPIASIVTSREAGRPSRFGPAGSLLFALFRLFDITKPWLVGWADKRDDATGVMLDDVIAGIFAAHLRCDHRRTLSRGICVMQGLIDAARAAHVMIATAESCTGGMVSAAITNTAGSSAAFDRGLCHLYETPQRSECLGSVLKPSTPSARYLNKLPRKWLKAPSQTPTRSFLSP